MSVTCRELPGSTTQATSVHSRTLGTGKRESGVFSHLVALQYGDEILLQIDSVTRRYVVETVYTTTPDDLTPLYPTTDDRLTLTTCTDYDFLTGVYLQRSDRCGGAQRRLAGT